MRMRTENMATNASRYPSIAKISVAYGKGYIIIIIIIIIINSSFKRVCSFHKTVA